MNYDNLTPEMKEQARACKSMEELAELANAIGTKLSEDELGAIAGGVQADTCTKDYLCPLDATRIPCPLQGCATFFEDLIKNCTELAPAECTELIIGEDVFPCAILKYF